MDLWPEIFAAKKLEDKSRFVGEILLLILK